MRYSELINDLRDFHRRLKVAGLLMLILFSVLLARFVWLQLVRYDYYSTRADNNRIALTPIDPGRGKILDRNGIELARNYSAYTLEISPGIVTNLPATIDELAKIVDIDSRDRSRFFKLKSESRNTDSLPIRTLLSEVEVARFVANRYRFPGVDVKARLFRQYPLGTLGSHMVGYIGRITESDLDRISDAEAEDAYRGASHFGKAGIERYYEFLLHGKNGAKQIEVDAYGREVRKLSRMSPEPGSNVILNVDINLQREIEKAFGSRRGALVAIDPNTGGILAFVSMPGFEPNLFVDGIDTANWNALNTSSEKPMLNRAINGTYPPGSTFKPFMALAGLYYGKRTPEQSISDPGYFNFGNNTFRDDKKGGHGRVDLAKSIIASCDTYYYMLANDLGIDRISEFMGRLGLGRRTGIDLEGESEGVLPSQQWKQSRFKKVEQQKWYAGETISIGIGQGYNAYTPVQLAMATAALANSGKLYRPRLARQFANPVTGEITDVAPEVIGQLEVSPHHLDVVKRAMMDVPKMGTSAAAFAGAPYASGGKTGTAQVYSLKGEKYEEGKVKAHLRDHALYIGFAPADKPVIALAVIVENSGFGAKAAAPIARRAFDYYLLGKGQEGPASDAPSDDDEEEGDDGDDGVSLNAAAPLAISPAPNSAGQQP